MTLSQTQKVILGLFTLLPFVLTPYVIYEVFHFVIDVVNESQYGEPEPSSIMSGILAFIFPILLLSVTSLTLLIFYIIHAVGNKTIDTTERLIWIIIFLFFGIIGFPIYWFMRVWNAPTS